MEMMTATTMITRAACMRWHNEQFIAVSQWMGAASKHRSYGAVDGLVSSAIQLPDEATTRLGHSSRDMISVIFNLAAHNAENGVCTVVC